MGLLGTTTQQTYYEGSDFGNYQFISLSDIINNFLIAYVGEDKLISKVNKTDVVFHAQRGLAELSFDTFKSIKAQEIEVPASLTMILPHDYVNYVNISWSDGSGIEHTIYPARKTSNPTDITQDSDGDYTFSGGALVTDTSSTTWENYKGTSPSENDNQDYNYDTDIYDLNEGRRYGLDPTHAQINGSFFIDDNTGKIHFSSNISGKTVILKYISDSLGTDDEMKVHKLAEEAMYKWIYCGILSTKRGIPIGALAFYKRERFAAIRKAKLRLSNIKIEEITQILRGKSKHIKH